MTDNITFKLFNWFSFSKTDDHLILSEGESVIVRLWSWRKFGFIRKLYTLKNGVVDAQVLG